MDRAARPRRSDSRTVYYNIQDYHCPNLTTRVCILHIGRYIPVPCFINPTRCGRRQLISFFFTAVDKYRVHRIMRHPLLLLLFHTHSHEYNTRDGIIRPIGTR